MVFFLNDLRQAIRMWRQSPSVTIVAVVALAMGIGANTAIFTVVHAVILNPLPYPDSNRIVNISHSGGGSLNEPTFTYLEKNNPGFQDLAAYQAGASMNLTGGDLPERVEAIRASRNYFHLFGANPILGRTFSAEDDRRGAPSVLVMSFGLWQRRFGGDPSVVAKTITLGGAPRLVVGVLSPSFKPYPPADVWVPLQADPNSSNLAGVLTVSARLPAGTTLARANAQVRAVGKQFAQTETLPLSKGDPKLEAVFMRERIVGDVRPALLILRVLSGVLYGVSPLDPAAFGGVSLFLVAVALVASFLPARRATRIDPMQALRHD